MRPFYTASVLRWAAHDESADPATDPAITPDTNAVNRAGTEPEAIAATGSAHPLADRAPLDRHQGAHGLGQLERVDRLLEDDVRQLLAVTRFGSRDDDDGE